MPDTLSRPTEDQDTARTVGELVRRARAAMVSLAEAGQERVDEAVAALAWAIYEPGRAKELAELAVADTGLGNVADKIAKNRRKTFGTLRDLLRVRTVGAIEEDPAKGLVRYAKPVGVVGAVTPSTNPTATPVNKAMMAVKGRNAVIVAPSPAGWRTTARTVELMRAELERAGFAPDLVQVVPAPVSKALTQALMEACDLVVVTGSQDNVRRAYRSGTPAIGVGAGNVPVIVDASADLDDAARKIAASKTFDNSTSCSSENALVVLDEVYGATLAALERAGAYLATPAERERIGRTLWTGGKLNRHLIARDARVLAQAWDLPEAAHRARFFLVEESGVGPEHPFSGEKLSLVLAVYRVRDFEGAVSLGRRILAHQGQGHSIGIHTREMEHARRLAEAADVVRVLVNQAHTFGNGGSFDNSLNFTLSMGCGTWAGNSISENLNWRHFVNITYLVTTLPEDKPREEELFGAYWRRHGKG